MSLSFAVWLFNFLGERAPFYLQPLGLLEQSVHFPHLSRRGDAKLVVSVLQVGEMF